MQNGAYRNMESSFRNHDGIEKQWVDSSACLGVHVKVFDEIFIDFNISVFFCYSKYFTYDLFFFLDHTYID